MNETDNIVGGPPAKPVRVGWVLGEQTLQVLGRILQPLVIGLMDELIEVTALVPCGAAGLAELPSPPVERVDYALPRWWESPRKVVEALAERLRKQEIGLLHALDSSTARFTQQLAVALDVNYVVSSYAFDDGRRLGRMNERLATVLAGCESVRADLVRHRVAPEDRILLLRPGVYRVSEPTCFDAPDRYTAIVAGGYGSFAAMDTVVRSFADLHARRCECVYFLLGAGGAERALRARISRLAMRQDVTFMDEQSPRQVVGIFKAADIYISPDPSPRMDIRSLLAMAAGIPVLTCLDAEGYLIDGRTAVRFARDDSADLTTKLLRLVEDHDAARRIARGALDYLGEYHRSATMVAAVAQTYRQAVK